jgi:hypothetical protein
MTDRFLTTRTRLMAALAVLLVAPVLTADEPIAAPPAPVINDAGEVVASVGEPTSAPALGSLAPVATDAPTDAGVVPAGRRDLGGRRGDFGALAPSTIGGGEPAYLPGGTASGIYQQSPAQINVPEGTAINTLPGETIYPYGEIRGDEASIRISDKPAEMVGQNPPGARPSSRICPECRYCQHGLPYHQCPECEPSEQMIRQYVRRHGIVYPADYGWSPPAKHPIDRVSIDYYRAFPQQWNGTAQAGPRIVRPSVYWPTDTTQLGYTYQHSPRWMPYPGMVPPVPHPAQWNIPLYGPYAGVSGPVPLARGNAVEAGDAAGSQRPSLAGQTPAWTPTDVTEAAIGPALNSSANAPNLTPVPF